MHGTYVYIHGFKNKYLSLNEGLLFDSVCYCKQVLKPMEHKIKFHESFSNEVASVVVALNRK